MSLPQTSDQRPVSTENPIDVSLLAENQETSFGESTASLLDSQNLFGLYGVSANDALHYIATEDIQSHLNVDQEAFSRIEALYNQLTYSLGQPVFDKDFDIEEQQQQRQLPKVETAATATTPRSNSLSTVATSTSLAPSLIPNSSQSQEYKTLTHLLPPLLMRECQLDQSPLNHHVGVFQLSSDKASFLNPLLVSNSIRTTTSSVIDKAVADVHATASSEKFCAKFSYPTNFATIASSPLFAKNFVLNSSNTEEKKENIPKGYEEGYDDTASSSNLQHLSNNVFPYYLQSNSSKLDELRELLNLLPCYGLPSSQVVRKQCHDDSVISNSSMSYTAIAAFRRNDTEETPTPLRCRDESSATIPSSPIAKILNANSSFVAAAAAEWQQEDSLVFSSEETEEPSLGKFAYVPLYNIHDMVFPIIFTFVERKQDFITCVKQVIKKRGKSSIFSSSSVSSLRPSSYTKRTNKCPSPSSSEIYDIGPKVLPIPFSKDFVSLKKTRFKPLSELKAMVEYQLPKDQTSNYMIDKMKKKPHCPNRPASGGLGPFRLHPLPLPQSHPQSQSLFPPSVSSSLSTATMSNGDSSGSIGSSSTSLTEAKNDRYYSRLNIYELSKILDLDQYDIELTKFIEGVILEIFGNYCDFKLGLQTWIRDTDKKKRKLLIEELYSYTSVFYPEIDPFKLEVVVRRGSYSMMQTRLRRERRLQKGRK